MYLDPGFGGMIVQVLVPIAAVGGGILFSIRKKLRKLFSKEKNKPSSANFTAHDTSDDAVDMLDD